MVLLFGQEWLPVIIEDEQELVLREEISDLFKVGVVLDIAHTLIVQPIFGSRLDSLVNEWKVHNKLLFEDEHKSDERIDDFGASNTG